MAGLYFEEFTVGRVFDHAWTRTVTETTLGTTAANLGMTDVRFPKPVFHGDTLRVKTTVLSLRESKSRPDAGIVEFGHVAINQRGETVAECTRQALMRKKPKDI